MCDMTQHRLENMYTHSTILYVKEQKTQLSFVAHNALKNEKYRPETCCIIGNYYSLKSQHEKAVRVRIHVYVYVYIYGAYVYVQIYGTWVRIRIYVYHIYIHIRT